MISIEFRFPLEMKILSKRHAYPSDARPTTKSRYQSLHQEVAPINAIIVFPDAIQEKTFKSEHGKILYPKSSIYRIGIKFFLLSLAFP